MTDSILFNPDDVVYLGYVEKTHGLKGGLRVRLFQGYGASEVPVGTVVLLDGNKPLTVSRCTFYGDSRFNLTFKEIRSKQEAEECRDSSIYVERQLANESLGFIPLYSFSGMEIISRGRSLNVVDVEPAGANPMLVVQNGENRFHVPVIMVVHEGSIDWKDRVIRLDLPPGLEELSL